MNVKRCISPDSSKYGRMLMAGAFSIFRTSGALLLDDLVIRNLTLYSATSLLPRSIHRIASLTTSFRKAGNGDRPTVQLYFDQHTLHFDRGGAILQRLLSRNWFGRRTLFSSTEKRNS